MALQRLYVIMKVYYHQWLSPTPDWLAQNPPTEEYKAFKWLEENGYIEYVLKHGSHMLTVKGSNFLSNIHDKIS